ncbi:MAG: cytochrome b N-terminal domain-containing protein [Bryobacteraceae bacterium]|nr:cytochrome b N-terminal domain-containing protein [Bryobacteraceae bacterium]MDW8379039.1 cytochrome b N-terminal domain-containing protein [Bryobacterales bacterium]
MKRRVIDWLESRTGLETAIKTFLYEDIPASAGWHQVLGSVALFCFLVQVFTGVLLAFNYAPTPGEAYNSVVYIMNELTGGKLIRGLHHWGASLMIIVVVLHMVQVFIWGAYKKPREATWVVGVTLLLITLAFGLTGYLLPWDNRAYWGTVVTTQIAGLAPVVGPYLVRLMGADGGVGVVTFARFYSLHTLLLPLAMVFLIGFHIYLVRKHGVAPAAGDVAPPKKFYPEQVFKDTVAVFIAFVGLFTMAIVAEVPLERLADPTDTSYIPRPDWYFLFLFQLLKFFEGPLEVVGAVILPNLAILVLFLVPFLDRGAVRKVTQRTTAITAVALAALGWTGLTVAAIRSTPPGSTQARVDGPPSWAALSPEELAGIGYFRRENCSSCHTLGEEGAKIGPDLAKPLLKRDAAWMIKHFKEPQSMRPGSQMPAIHLPDAQLNALAAFLLKLNPANAKELREAPEVAVEGAMIYQQFQCGSCHQVNGVGVKMGPSLNGLSKRRDRAWVEGHFSEPQKYSPGTIMPPYRFTPKQMERITSYLMSL